MENNDWMEALVTPSRKLWRDLTIKVKYENQGPMYVVAIRWTDGGLTRTWFETSAEPVRDTEDFAEILVKIGQALDRCWTETGKTIDDVKLIGVKARCTIADYDRDMEQDNSIVLLAPGMPPGAVR